MHDEVFQRHDKDLQKHDEVFQKHDDDFQKHDNALLKHDDVFDILKLKLLILAQKRHFFIQLQTLILQAVYYNITVVPLKL